MIPFKVRSPLPTYRIGAVSGGGAYKGEKRFLINGINGQSKVVCVRLIELYFGSYVMD